MVTSIGRFTEAQTLVSKAACPACETRGLELVLSCEQGWGCHYEARCESCGIAFMVQLHQGAEMPDDVLQNLSCQVCGQLGAEATMHCEMPTRHCDTRLACRSCGHAYASIR